MWARQEPHRRGTRDFRQLRAAILDLHDRKVIARQRSCLLTASPLPIAWTIIEFLRTRRIDALSILALAGIVLERLTYLRVSRPQSRGALRCNLCLLS
jgi:hypothetical protein